MFTIVSIILILLSIVLVAVVLLQPGKGDLSASFGGISSQMGSMFGMQKTANILAKATRIIAFAILFLVLLYNIMLSNKFFGEGDQRKPVTEGQSIPSGMQAPPIETPKK